MRTKNKVMTLSKIRRKAPEAFLTFASPFHFFGTALSINNEHAKKKCDVFKK